MPINIPAFAISLNMEPDINAELIAHGYSNALSGLFGGMSDTSIYEVVSNHCQCPIITHYSFKFACCFTLL